MALCDLPLNSCADKSKRVKFLKVPTATIKSNSPEQKKYWRNVIRSIERDAKRNQDTPSKSHDLSVSLPKSLYKRVSKIVPMVQIEDEIFEDYAHADADKGDEKGGPMGSFHESNITEILEEEKLFNNIDLNFDPKYSRERKTQPKYNWFTEFACSKRKDRIKWKSKIYDLDKNIWEKPLFEQAEALMDTAAERFCNWVNSLSENKETDISKDMLKSLFSVDMGSGPLADIHLEPKPIKAVPNAVAEGWGLPEMSIELQLMKLMEEEAKHKGKQIRTVAFGRTLPHYLREWVPSDVDKPIEPIFPEELLTRETLFKGISHLRSTRALVEHYKENSDIDRPKYLIETGCFKPSVKRQSKAEIPFYELIKK